MVVKVDQPDIIEGANIEGYRFKTIWRIMSAMKSFYPYNNLIVWRIRDFLDIENFLPPILSVFTVVFLNSRSSWLIQKPQNNLFFRIGSLLRRFSCRSAC